MGCMGRVRGAACVVCVASVACAVWRDHPIQTTCKKCGSLPPGLHVRHAFCAVPEHFKQLAWHAAHVGKSLNEAVVRFPPLSAVHGLAPSLPPTRM